MAASRSKGCLFQLKWILLIFFFSLIALFVIFVCKDIAHSIRAQLGLEAPDVVSAGNTAYTDYSVTENYGEKIQSWELHDLATFVYNTIHNQPNAQKLIIQVVLSTSYTLYTDKYGNKVPTTYQTNNLVINDLDEIRRYKEDYDYAGDDTQKLFYTHFIQELRSEPKSNGEPPKLADIQWHQQKQEKSSPIPLKAEALPSATSVAASETEPRVDDTPPPIPNEETSETKPRLIRSPKVPYPPQALQLHITGDVRVQITVSAGRITDVQAISGPGILSSAAARWIKAKWEFAPDQTGTFTVPLVFQIAH